MEMTFAYGRRSSIVREPAGLAISLSPNLRRDRVSFNGTLRSPLRFREAISALHDVVINDMRYKPRDKSDYEAYLAQEKERERAIHQTVARETKAQIEARRKQPIPVGLEADFRQSRTLYWKARDQYSNYLSRHDPELWRMLVPCDPVITVAPDVLFFECFSVDESSYGCLTVARDAFTTEQDVALGTTNVDYSWSLYEHFQNLRSYRETKFLVDPAGFEVHTTEAEGYREEKIDLPSSWLRGFMQLQSAMSLPMRRVPVSREGLYNVVAWLKRHKAARSPRAVRFELNPGQPVAIVLEPWEKRITLHSTPYAGPRAETIRVWGRDRLRVLARLLPLAEGADVYLLGTGLPSFWVVRMGEMQLTLGLSGWTTNDWTSASALDQLAPPGTVDEATLTQIASVFRSDTSQSFEQLREHTNLAPPNLLAGLNRLALLGQVIHDLPAGVYRWRQVMPTPLTNEQIGPENVETVEGRELLRRNRVKVTRDEQTPSGLRLLAGQAENRPVELLLNGDGHMVRGKCTCSHHFTGGLRRGPCRHLQALRNKVLAGNKSATLGVWFDSLWK
ncbi:MAG: hypothetical protein JWM11_3809 [Planctomycetaceae bacterium]|nr:hypothetical protein [Planctomycetaceae bacterium]